MRRDRLFTLSWNNAKIRGIRSEVERMKKCEARGAHFANGRVMLDSGAQFETMHGLEEIMKQSGTYAIHFDDEHVRMRNREQVV